MHNRVKKIAFVNFAILEAIRIKLTMSTKLKTKAMSIFPFGTKAKFDNCKNCCCYDKIPFPASIPSGFLHHNDNKMS